VFHVPQWYEDPTHPSYWTNGAIIRRVFWRHPLFFTVIAGVIAAAVVIVAVTVIM